MNSIILLIYNNYSRFNIIFNKLSSYLFSANIWIIFKFKWKINKNTYSLYRWSSAFTSTWSAGNIFWYEVISASNFWENLSKSPRRSPILSPFLAALLEYVGPIPFLVVPRDCVPFSNSWRPSTCWWKSNTMCARSEIINRSCQFFKPFASLLSNSSKRPGRCITTPFPETKFMTG